MKFVHGDSVGSGIARIGFAAELGADGDLCGEADDPACDLVFDEGVDGFVDIARVGGGEGCKDYQGFAGAMGRGMAASHISASSTVTLKHNRLGVGGGVYVQ